MTAPYRVEILGKHSRDGFDCGNEALNEYLCRRANQDQRKRFAVCYLLIEATTDQIVGYYTLSSGGVSLADLPPQRQKGLPRYPSVPIARIGRLAIAKSEQERGLGGVLLFDAIKRASASSMGVYAVLVDAIDEQAVRFYQHHSFEVLESNPRILFLPIADGLKRITKS
ncbi:GNAT family N-acetyltransferase [Roseimaritima ulvae]|uniref:N-acetyltransferase domain-containing protein n=1 Tax=Roseimaritima ulvae TaxID=980254 RepID=A0A5B9QXL4_9BACT|nr:GNAT family N-acetyltransferase [Roseimaritima ulvae]QEG43804.1 hypothetical protein UC8_58610 [Roseimaritima ulvae]